jgi:outer membrane protein assembly factor BamB
MRLSATVTFIAAAVLANSPVSGEDWPQFRGPTGQGHSTATGLPTQWSATDNVVWKQAIPGTSWSSPALYQGRIYLTTAVPSDETPKSDHSLRAVCLDAKSGKQIWDLEVFSQDGESAPRIHGKNSHASPSPIVAGDRLYLHFGHQGTACLSLDGNVIWKTQIQYAPVHGNGGSPVIVDGAMVISCDGGDKQFVIALDCGSGKPIWQTTRPTEAIKKFAFSTPLAIDIKGQRQVISPGADMVCAYDLKTGDEIWRVAYTGYSVIPRPVVGHGLVFLSTSYDSAEVLAIRIGGRGDVTDSHVAWRLKKGAPHTASLLLVGEELYMVSDRGIATCVDSKTGTVHWQERIGGNYSASPLFADGRIYFQSEQGTGVVVAASKEFKELARNELEERTLASYAVGDGALFIRTAEHLLRVQK